MHPQTPLFVLVSVLIGAVFVPTFAFDTASPFFAHGSLANDFTPGSMLFTGDIFLGRDVERLSNVRSAAYPFEKTRSLLDTADIVVGNFEAPIPITHVSTPDFSFAFSVPEDRMQVLAEVGFDALSLANNHTLDYGVSGLLNTRRVCAEAGIVCGGDPKEITNTSRTYHTVGDTTVGLLSLNAVSVTYTSSTIHEALRTLNDTADVQVAYVHWGTEYEHAHDQNQAKLARLLVDNGVDLVVGHHPHVVQDIEMYNGALIVYSLGNYIFDQYFDESVMTGVLLEVTFESDELTVRFIPHSSEANRAQPDLLPYGRARSYLDALFARSAIPEEARIDAATVRVPLTVADF